jgi:hypothetical protein
MRIENGKKYYRFSNDCSPSESKGFETVNGIEVIQSRVTYTETHYGYKLENNVLETISGEKLTLNPDFIVQTRKVKFLIHVVDQTAWVNYSKKTVENSTASRFYLLRPDETPLHVQDYQPDGHKPIYTEVRETK